MHGVFYFGSFVIWLNNKTKICQVLQDKQIVKLVWEKPEMYNFKAISWSYSKGDTYNNICIILTDTYRNLNLETFQLPNSIISLNKLYVALTRSRGNVYLIKYQDFINTNI